MNLADGTNLTRHDQPPLRLASDVWRLSPPRIRPACASREFP
jgi:hypothetical protein